jgi:hypothetical protein
MKETEKHYSKKIPLISMPCLFYGHSAHFALPIQRGIRRLGFWGGRGGGDAQKNSQDRKEVQWEGGGSFVVWNVIGWRAGQITHINIRI